MTIQKWQFQEAKNKFSYLVKQAKTGSPKKKLSKYLLAPEISADNIDFERNKETW